MVEKVAEAAHEAGDDLLFEKFVAGDKPTVDELKAAIRKATVAMKLFPVVCGTAFKNKGIQPLLDSVVDYLPSPLDVPDTMANDPKTGRTRAAARLGHGAIFGPRLQDHDRPLRRSARLPARVFGQHEDGRFGAEHDEGSA